MGTHAVQEVGKVIGGDKMRRLTPLPLFLVVIFSIMVGVSMLIGHNQPFPALVERLHLADCALPCWDGIVPGISSAREVEDRINDSLPDFESSLAADGNKFLTWTHVDEIDRINSVVDVTFDHGLV